MIQKETYLSGVDNSGVISMKCIHIHGGFKQRTANISQLVKISCRKDKQKKKKTIQKRRYCKRGCYLQ